MLELRSKREIAKLRIAGQVVAEAHQRVAEIIEPGITTAALNAVIERTFLAHDAEPLFLGYPGEIPFPAVSCISINEEVVHGIPGDRALNSGDIVSIDTGCRVKGWCGDAAVTHAVGAIDSQSRALLQATQAALDLAIELMSQEAKWSAIAANMQALVERAGFSVIEDFVGHGIGRQMHEPPQVPNFDSQKLREDADFELRAGLVLAIEPMVAAGLKDVRCQPDHWTQVTVDGSRAAHFEHTVALTAAGPEILTGAAGAATGG